MSSPPPDRAALRTFLRAQALVRRKWRRVGGLALGEYAVLEEVGAVPGCTPSQLAAALGMPRNLASGAISALLQAGLVRRVTHGSDRRRARLYLTPEGHRIRVRCAARWSEIQLELSFKGR